MEEPIKLTRFSHGSGCGCKISPQVLEKILSGHRTEPNARLWVGNAENDDAAVFSWDENSGLVSTVDFFTPIVDDAFVFGQAAAANALSDVYAMGGKPLFALAILGWPVEKLPPELASQVLDGARNICSQAGVSLAGGHSIDSQEPMFGLVVNGIVEKDHLKRNNGAKPGDILFLTKPLGTGILAAAAKREKLDEKGLMALNQSLVQLNSSGEKLGKMPWVHAMTDVTGFGIMGHLTEMAEASQVSAEISFAALPIIPETKPFLSQQIMPDASFRNWNAFSQKVHIDDNVDPMASFQILPDPQTNGGLLLAIDPEKEMDLQALFLAAGLHDHLKPIGKMKVKSEKVIEVKP